MKHAGRIVLFTLFFLFAAYPVLAANPYSANAAKAVQLLTQMQNSDGSWGTSNDIKMLCTVEAVTALQALNQQTPAYYWGITWLENYSAPTVDYVARRIIALSSHGDNLTADLALMEAAQTLTSPGNSGWGLTSNYNGSPIDSAMALLASTQLGVGYTTGVQAAISYLKSAQLTGTDKGWALAQETSSDPMTTALVVTSLANYVSNDSTLSTYIANGVTSLTTNVSTISPLQLQALAYIAYMNAGYTADAATLITSIAAQFGSSSYSQDAFTTAVSARALAVAMGTNAANLSQVVEIPDPYLRAAINAALGKSAMDAITQGDMLNLTTLNAAGMGISNLTGLQYATNLTTANLSNNEITNTSPLSGLKNLTANLSGNPTGPAATMPAGYETQTAVVPALSLPGFIFTIVLIVAVALMYRRKVNGTLMVLVAVLLSMQTVAAAGQSSSATQGLTADEIQHIQAISQGVLTAKKNAVPDPDLQTLRQQVAVLSQALNSLGGRIRTPHISLQVKGAASSGTTSEQEAAKQQERDNKVRNILNEVRTQRNLVEVAVGNGDGMSSIIKLNAAAKLQELENAVEDILNTRTEERAQKIALLRGRLKVKSGSLIIQPTTEESTPTISTITRHRVQ